MFIITVKIAQQVIAVLACLLLGKSWAVEIPEVPPCLVALSVDGSSFIFRFDNQGTKAVRVFPPGGTEAPIETVGNEIIRISQRKASDVAIELNPGEAKVWRIPVSEIMPIVEFHRQPVVSLTWHQLGLTSERIYVYTVDEK